MKISLFLTLVLFSTSAHALSWKGVFIAGDNSIENFDNGRRDLTALFSRIGELSTAQLSSSSQHIGKDGVLPANADGIISAFRNLKVKEGEGCLIHLTSHGAQGRGFYIALEQGVLPPNILAQMVNASCGNQPTVVLVSACFSGQFITQDLAGPNRIILTAARADRPSFGCSADTRYTYWDGCLVENLPRSRTWAELYQNTSACITQKEGAIGVPPSEPQAFFGSETANWQILE